MFRDPCIDPVLILALRVERDNTSKLFALVASHGVQTAYITKTSFPGPLADVKALDFQSICEVRAPDTVSKRLLGANYSRCLHRADAARNDVTIAICHNPSNQ